MLYLIASSFLLKIEYARIMCTSLRVEITSSIPPSLNVLRMTCAQSHRRDTKSLSLIFRSVAILVRILFSTVTVGYSCSSVIANLSRNASLRTLVPMNLPSSEPLPLVLAVANTLNPLAGFTYLPSFLRNTPLPSSTDCKQRILFDARSISSRRRTAPLSSASITGPLCHTVSPLTKRKPPIRSSSSVSIVMLTLMSSLFC